MGTSRLKNGITFLKNLWRLGSPYFLSSKERWRARLLLAAVFGLALVHVLMLVQFNNWYQEFYSVLQNKDLPAFLPLSARFLGLAAIYILAAIQRGYWQQMLHMRWRVWLTEQYVGAWLAHKSHYRLQIEGLPTDNPDQRIAEDLDGFSRGALSLTLGIFQSVITLVSFVVILWNISPTLTLPLGDEGLAIEHYMVWVALGYAIIGSVFVHYVGRRLISLHFMQQKLEADFRFNLVRVRENAESIALYGGEGSESPRLGGLVERIRGNWWSIMAYTRRLAFFQTGFTQLELVFGIFAAAPSYFAGQITQGTLIQIGDAFTRVEGALAWFVSSYGTITAWKATVDRLLSFEAALATLAAEDEQPAGVIVVRDGYTDLRADHLTLTVPGGRTILADLVFEIKPGDRVLITGPTGIGKSTLFRALAGIWSFGEGKIQMPSNARTLFLPQKPYMPISTLRAALTYPDPEGALPDAALREALRAVGLELFIDCLDDDQYWGMQMSIGEQQRLAAARAILQQPDWLFLDEATSALDDEGEKQVYDALIERLPRAAIVSIAHRPSLAAYHERTLALAEFRPASESDQQPAMA
ncbi:MAG TPA: ABC transporter ATP-binding protein/permease [Chloroflexota bacterium]